MCDGMKLLPSMKKKLKKKLYCTIDNSCWCMALRGRFSHENDICLSPKELLNSHSAILCDNDKQYLRNLSGRVFIRSSE